MGRPVPMVAVAAAQTWRSALTAGGGVKRMSLSPLKDTRSKCKGCLNPLRKGDIWPDIKYLLALFINLN